MSEIRANTITHSDGSGPVTLTKQEAAKTLLTYDHPAETTVDSLNTSTITDVSTGLIKTEMTTAFSSATARQVFVCAWATADGGSTGTTSDARGLNAYQDYRENATGAVQTVTTNGSLSTNNGGTVEVDCHYVAIFGDLA